jgi:hypothetical protein
MGGVVDGAGSIVVGDAAGKLLMELEVASSIHFFKRAVQFRTTVKVSAGAAALAAGWAANRNFWPSELTSQ